MAELSSRFADITVDPEELLLDPNNPRYQGDFPDYVFVPYEQIAEDEHQSRALGRILQKRFNVRELAESIAEIGYLPIDRLVVTKHVTGRYLVVEGNRRAAALKLIVQGKVEYRLKDAGTLRSIPALLLQEPYESVLIDQWLIQGTRHVSGIKEWGPYQKAKALNVLLKERGLSVKDAAVALGLTKLSARRSLRSFIALQSVEEHPLYGRIVRPEDFSYFEEMLKIPALRHNFGWSNHAEKFIDKDKRDLFLRLILGDPSHDQNRKIIAAIDLRRVPLILGNADARRSLEDPNDSFEQALHIAESADRKVQISDTISYVQVLIKNLTHSITKLTEPQRNALREARQALDDLLERR